MTTTANAQVQFATGGKSYTELLIAIFKAKTQQQTKKEVQAA